METDVRPTAAKGLTDDVRGALGVLAEVDWSAVDDDDLEAVVSGLVGVASKVASVSAPALREWDRRRLWGTDGSRSPRSRLARDAHCSPATTGRLTTLARKLAVMPVTAAALAEGRIHLDHAWRLAIACTTDRAGAFAIAEQALVDIAAEEADFDSFCRHVQYWEQATDDILDTAETNHRRRHSGRRAHCSRTFAGTWRLDATMDPVGGEMFATALERIYRRLLDQDWTSVHAEHGEHAGPDLLPRSAQQRRHDALVEMARLALAAPPQARKPRPLITVLVGYEELNGPIRETFNGNILTRHHIADLLTEADIERAVYSPDNRIIELSHTARFFTGGLRRLLEIRDHRCTHHTCDEPAEHCQADHHTEYSDGGPTTQDNGRLLCRTHNRQRPGRRKNPTHHDDPDDDPHRPTDADTTDDTHDPVCEATSPDDPVAGQASTSEATTTAESRTQESAVDRTATDAAIADDTTVGVGPAADDPTDEQTASDRSGNTRSDPAT